MHWAQREILGGPWPTSDMALEIVENVINQETWEDYAPDGLDILVEEAENRELDLSNILSGEQ